MRTRAIATSYRLDSSPWNTTSTLVSVGVEHDGCVVVAGVGALARRAEPCPPAGHRGGVKGVDRRYVGGGEADMAAHVRAA
jgi:hypothetical protein